MSGEREREKESTFLEKVSLLVAHRPSPLPSLDWLCIVSVTRGLAKMTFIYSILAIDIGIVWRNGQTFYAEICGRSKRRRSMDQEKKNLSSM